MTLRKAIELAVEKLDDQEAKKVLQDLLDSKASQTHDTLVDEIETALYG